MRRHYALISASLWCATVALGIPSDAHAAADLASALDQAKRTGKPLLIVGTAPG